MKLEHKPFAVIITPTSTDLNLFVQQVTGQYNDLVDQNIIIDLSTTIFVTLETIKLFADLSKGHKKAKKSFVIVVREVNLNKVSVKMTVVPTMQEAKDIIEIEEIERDLGI